MKDFDVKSKVLKEIMDLMGEKEGDALKMKSPKFAAAKIEVVKPEAEVEAEVKPEMEVEGEKELDDDTIKKLLEMMNGK